MDVEMNPGARSVLAVNAGSSSIKFALFGVRELEERLLHGHLERVGQNDTALRFSDCLRNEAGNFRLSEQQRANTGEFLIDWLADRTRDVPLLAVGHRVVQGMEHAKPEPVTRELIDELRSFSPIDPEHLPRELQLIELFGRRAPELLQVACFDTAFHHTMPAVARLLPIPRRLSGLGIRRYGFHGLSYEYILKRLASLDDARALAGRAILAHLGGGSSMVALRGGKSVDTSMGFTPASGLAMSTRSGDIDPGLLPFLERTVNMDSARFYEIMTRESGLLGVSETSSDMRDLLRVESSDVRASEAVELFCYQAKKCIGALAAALGGLDTLVFSGGIGENAPIVRTRICDDLGFLGIELDERSNASSDAVISSPSSRVTVRVIRTDEEVVIARAASSVANSNRGDEERESNEKRSIDNG